MVLPMVPGTEFIETKMIGVGAPAGSLQSARSHSGCAQNLSWQDFLLCVLTTPVQFGVGWRFYRASYKVRPAANAALWQRLMANARSRCGTAPPLWTC